MIRTFPRTGCHILACLIVLTIGSVTSSVRAENIIFPHVKTSAGDVSGIIDVSLPPYSADRSGRIDVTAVLQRAYDEHQSWTTVYLPNGTYLVSNTIRMSPMCATGGGSGGAAAGCVIVPILQGQSRTGTVIKLASGTFTNAASPKPVVFSGDGVAQQFQRGIHNLTVLVGSNNPGANGIRWFSNNTGLMSDVNVISQDASANIGVDLAGGEQGPCGMRDIYIRGFATGCKSDALNSVTIWNLTVEDAAAYGVHNSWNPLYIDNLMCARSLVAVRNQGSMTLVNARFTGGTSGKSAIENTGMLFARNVIASGYQKALTTTGRTAPSGLAFDEYTTNQISLFPSPTRSMNLPARSMPDVPWEQDTTKWGNVWAHKGGLGTPQKSDSASLQSLIDNPNITTICVPSGRVFQINGDILVRGNISRIVGTGGSINGAGRLIITRDLLQPVIKIERISGLQIINQSDKTVILESYTGSQSGAILSSGTGDFFLSDICGAANVFSNPAQRVWAWQYNAEGGTGVAGTGHVKTVAQDVGTMRIFGWKDEPQFQSLELTKGIVEVLGYMFYASSSNTGQTMFVIRDGAQFCAAGVSQVSFNGTEFSNLVQQTRGGQTLTLTSSANGGSAIPLYTGYDSAAVMAVRTQRSPRVNTATPTVRVVGRAIVVAGLAAEGSLTVDLFGMNGTRLPIAVQTNRALGAVDVVGPVSPGAYVLVIGSGTARSVQRVLVP